MVGQEKVAWIREKEYLFGSYARGEATAQSDLDLRVDRGKMTAFLEQIKPEEVLIYAS